MITLEQIRLLEGKITRAIDLIRVLKDENTTLRKGLESAQRRMRELETLVDGFKADQKEIESVIVRTLHNLDELEETAAGSAAAGSPAAAPAASAAGTHAGGGIPAASTGAIPATSGGTAATRRAERSGSTAAPMDARNDAEPPAPKEELDIF
jgi:TolA-binding protein